MKIEIIMPQMGESIAEGTISKWLKEEGEFVHKEEPLFEVSTDKIDTAIPAPESGIVSKIVVQEGATVPINTVVAFIETEGAQKVDVLSVEFSSVPLTIESEPQMAIDDKKADSVPVETAQAVHEIHLSPAVRKLVREYTIDISRIKGSGVNGRINAQDVLKYLEQKSTAIDKRKIVEETMPIAEKKISVEEKKPQEKVEVVPMTTMRKRIAEHMVMSKRTSPHVTTVFEIDMTNVVKAREQLKPAYEKEGVKLTYLSFIVQAVIKALQAYPVVNASVSDTNIIYKKDINIGIAVALEWGLIVPVIKNADAKSLLRIAKEIQDLGERARMKKLKPEDIQDSTFSITNPGSFGAVWGTPIINQPNVAIAGVGAIVKRPVIINNAIAIRSMMYLSLSYDHRIIDGAVADSFLAHSKNTLENWK